MPEISDKGIPAVVQLIEGTREKIKEEPFNMCPHPIIYDNNGQSFPPGEL